MADHFPLNRISVNQALAGGSDVLLWKKPGASVLLLVSSTSLWFLFERAGYNLLSFVSNVFLLLISILFFWAKSASLLNRPLPPIPSMEISEGYAISAADEIRVWINAALSIACDITIGKNLKRLLQVTLVFWMMSYVGSFFNFLTVLYVGVLLSLSVPVLYMRYQAHVDDKLCIIYRIIRTQYRRIDEVLLSKLQRTINIEKKTQ